MVRASRRKYMDSRTQGNLKDSFKRIFRAKETAVITQVHYWMKTVKTGIVT